MLKERRKQEQDRNARFFYEPLILERDELDRVFNETGMVFYDHLVGKAIAVKAFVSGQSGSNPVETTRKIAEKYSIRAEGVEYTRHCGRTKFLNQPMRLSAKDFFDDFDVLRKSFADYRKHYENVGLGNAEKGLPEQEMYLYYTKCGDTILFYGTSLGSVKREEMPAKVLLADTERPSYSRYLKRCENEKKNQKAEEKGVRAEIAKWLDKTNFQDFAEEIRQRVMGQPDLDAVLASVYSYLRCIAGKMPAHNNIILTAPSGCGKTETFRALKDYFAREIPSLVMAQVDMSNITEAGFKGTDPKEVVRSLLDNEECGGIGILFLDELDKKIIPSYASGGQNVNAAVQSQLLTMVEGTIVKDGNKKTDTGLTMFVGLGSFDECRKTRDVKHVGFGQNSEEKDHYAPIAREDIIGLGASYELVGRFSMVLNYRPLDYDTVNNIIRKSRKEISKQLKVNIELAPAAWEELHALANGKYGCRIFASYLREAVMGVYAQYLVMDGGTRRKKKILVEGERKASLVDRETVAENETTAEQCPTDY